MRKINLKIKGTEYQGKISSDWEELTVLEYLAIQRGGTNTQVLSSFLDIDIKVLENTTTDLTQLNEHIAELIRTAPDLENIKRIPVDVQNTRVHFPKNINFTKYGQKAMLSALIQQDEDMMNVISKCFAIYLQPLMDGEFDSMRVDHWEEVVNDLPIVKVYPWVVFFFKKLNGLKFSTSPTTNESLKRSVNLSTDLSLKNIVKALSNSEN